MDIIEYVFRVTPALGFFATATAAFLITILILIELWKQL